MTQDEIVRMAREAGPLISTPFDVWCERFAALVAAAECDACATVCEEIYTGEEACGDWPTPEMCATAIRARAEHMVTNSIRFYSGLAEVLRLSKDGIWANPEIPADEAAKLVLEAIDHNIKELVQKAVEAEREAICPLVYGLCGSDNDGERIVRAIRARGNT